MTTLRVAMIGYGFMGAAHSQGWRTAPTFDEQYELPARLAFNALLPDYGNTLSGENVGFIGLVALGLAGLGVWAGPARLAWMRVWAVAIALFGIVMASATRTPSTG